jgi:hypothetical protein
MPIEQVLIRADQKRAGTAGRIENAKLRRLFRRFVFEQFVDGVLDDVIDNVSGRVIYAACFLNFRFVFDFGAMAFGQANNLAEKLFVNLAENVGWQNRKFVRTFR